MLEARQARLQQMAASTQTSRKWPNVHYRYSRGHTGTLGTTQAEAYRCESRYASFRTICCSIQDAKEMFISAVMAITSIYRLPLGNMDTQAMSSTCHRDVVSFAQYLPRLPAELDASLAPMALTSP